MAIERFYKQTIKLYRNEETENANGVYKKQPVYIKDIIGRLDLNSIARVYQSDKETFIDTYTFFTAYDAAIEEGSVLQYGGINYDIISPTDPFSAQHHMEIKLVRKI